MVKYQELMQKILIKRHKRIPIELLSDYYFIVHSIRGVTALGFFIICELKYENVFVFVSMQEANACCLP